MLRIQVFQHFNGLQGLFSKKQVFSGKGSVFQMSHSTSVHIPKSGMTSVPMSHTEVSQDTSVIHILALALGCIGVHLKKTGTRAGGDPLLDIHHS